MSYNARRILTPRASRKRKEREAFYSDTSPNFVALPMSVSRAASVIDHQATASSKAAEPHQQPLSSNRLLAGYMAHEFLTKGTFGQKFDPVRAEALPVSPVDLRRSRQSQSQAQQYSEAEPSRKSKLKGYAEVALLLKSDGAHIPGVVNPTQLARWFHM